MLDWALIGGILEFYAVYFTTQLVRCAVFSFVLTGVVMLLRNMLFSKHTFLRGALWAVFLIVPFLGRLKMFYENAAVRGMTGWIMAGTISCLWVDYIYMAGILTAAVCVFGKRLRLRKTIAGMEKILLEDMWVYVTELNVTPFTVGLLKPRIVLPEIMVDGYGREELKVIVGHEQTHIRLGHLWYGFTWDILRCLLWVNPFLTILQKSFRADLEDICDRVCIQNSGKTAHEYGLVLLKSLKLLRTGQEDFSPATAYAGEKDFLDMKRRMEKIADFQPYRKELCKAMTVAVFVTVGVVLMVIHTHSYRSFNESKDIMVYQYDGGAAIISSDTEYLSRMVSYDDSCVYVRREDFEDFLCRNDAKGEIYIVFGGFYKLPGMGGAADMCCYESGSEEKVVQLPYESVRDSWYYVLFKML